MKVHEYNQMMAYMLRPRQKFAIGGGVVEGEDLGSREGYAKISKISRDLKQTPTRTDISVEKQKVVDDVLEQLVKEGNTTFEKVSEVIEKITAKGTMSKTTARTGIENSKFLSQFEFLGPGAGLDKEILESDWFKRNYPNATTIEEASGKQPLAKVRNQYKLAKERSFPLSQKQLADEIGISRNVLRDYISYSRTSKKPQNPTDISRVKRAKEFVNLLKEAGITFSGGGQRYGSSDIRFIANPEQIANLKKSYEEDFLQAFTKEQKELLDNTVRSTYDDMIKSGNLMEKFKFAKLLNTKVGFGSYNAMVRAIDRVLSKKEIDAFPKTEFLSGGERETKKRKSIEMAGEDANQIRKSQNKFLKIMKDEFKKLSDKNLLKLIKNTPQLLNQVTLRFNKKTGEFFNENIDDLDMDTIRKRSLPNVEHIKKIKEAGIQAEWPYNRQVAVANINKHIKESVEGFINANEPLLRRKDIPIETKQKIKNQILNIENKMNEMNLRMFANNKYRGVPEGLPAIDRETGQLTSFFENVKSMGLNPETYSGKIPSRFKPIAIAAGLTGGLITAAAANTESPQQASELIGQMPQGSPGQINPEDKSFIEEYPLITGGLAAASPLVTPKGRKIYGALAKPLLKAFGSVPAATYFAGKELMSEDPNYAIAGADLLLPELGKRIPTSGTGIMSKIGRFALNPIGRLARGFTPAGIALQGVELVNQAMKEQKRIEDMRENDPEAYQQFIAEQEDMMGVSAASGGLIRKGFADGPEDPSKRNFMKILGGLASLPVVGRFFDIAKEAPVVKNIFTEITKLKNTATEMPEWFPTFLDKFRKEGKAENVFKREKVEVTEAEYNKAIAEGKGENYYTDAARTPEYKANNPDHMDYFKLEETDELIYTTYTNDKVPGVRVDDMDGNVDVMFENDYSQPVSINYTAPGAKGPETGRADIFVQGESKMETKPKGEFVANDVETYATDPDGGFDTEDVIANSLDDMMEGTTRQMEEYATGKPVKKLSRGEGRVIEAEIRAEQAAERAAEEAAEAADDFD